MILTYTNLVTEWKHHPSLEGTDSFLHHFSILTCCMKDSNFFVSQRLLVISVLAVAYYWLILHLWVKSPFLLATVNVHVGSTTVFSGSH